MTRAFRFPLLADENVGQGVVELLVQQGKNVRTVHEEGLAGQTDVAILRRAVELGRVVLTHDTDFGMLAVQSGEPVIGIICLRPGHIVPGFVIETIRAIETGDHEVEPPFVLVAERRDDRVRVRVRRP
jgi:predicted nuclease of predicted toxin-antitoxin system